MPDEVPEARRGYGVCPEAGEGVKRQGWWGPAHRPWDPRALPLSPRGRGWEGGLQACVWALCLQGSGRPLLSPAAGRRKGCCCTKKADWSGARRQGLRLQMGRVCRALVAGHCPLCSVSRTGTVSTGVQNRVSRERARRGLSS